MQTAAVPAGTIDVDPLSDALQAAFWDDPVSVWMYPDEESRSRKLAKSMSMLLKIHYLPARTVWTTADTVGGALWAAPGHWKLSTAEMLRMAPSMIFVVGRRGLAAQQMMNLVDSHHPREPHWYLGVLGTSPAHQGKGIGSALMQPVLERCDRERVPAYLESSKEANIPFYERHGFKVTGRIDIPKGGPSLYPMWRDPQS